MIKNNLDEFQLITDIENNIISTIPENITFVNDLQVALHKYARNIENNKRLAIINILPRNYYMFKTIIENKGQKVYHYFFTLYLVTPESANLFMVSEIEKH